MAKRKGQVVAATLVTPDTTCKFPVVDINDVGGGRLILDTIAERNAIPPKFLKAGMIVYVGGTVKKDFKLKPGYGSPLTDANWEEYAPGVPAGVLTAHQKLEDIQYATPVPSFDGLSTITTLVQKLAEIDSRLGSALTSHQTVESIAYGNPAASGFNTLTQKLADLESKAAAVPGIEDITWKTTPTDHAHYSYLSDELEYIYNTLADMNDPTKITVTNLSTSTTTDLQSKLNAIDTRTYKTSEIVDESSGSPVLLSVVLAKLSKADGILYDGMSTTTVKDKIDNLQSQINNVSLNVEDIDWGTTPSGTGRNTNLGNELNYLFNNMNKADKISVPNSATDTTNAGKLDTVIKTLFSAASGAIQKVEDISWNTTPTGTGRDGSLANELNNIFSNLATINADMNKANKINVPNSATDTTNAGTLDNVIKTLFSAASGAVQKVEDISWNTTPSGSGRSGSLATELNNLFTTIADMNLANKISVPNSATDTTNAGKLDNIIRTLFSVANGAIQKVEDISWNTTPTGTGRNSTLANELNYLFNNMNKADKISVPNSATDTSNAGKLDDIIKDLYSKVGGASKEIQYLLFNTSAPEVGSLTSQEFLTTWAGKIMSIAVYTNSDAVLAATSGSAHAVSVTLEECGPAATSYTAISGTAVDLDASDSGLLKEITPATPIAVTANTRIRLNITAFDSGNTVDSFSVRVKIKED